MAEFSDVIEVAFSGSDASRVLIVGLLASLLCSSKFPPLPVGLLAILFDRAWPFIAMSFAGYDGGAIAAAIANAFVSLPSDALPLLMRSLAILVLVSLGYRLRLMLHGHRPIVQAAKR